jgi:DNA-binding IclR family transcriptional regulator
MSSPARVLAILALFTRDRPVWHTDDLNETLGYSRATGYRYVKDLVEGGFLQKVSAGRYALGARIVELDYHLRHSDPVLLAAVPVMDALAARTKLDVVLTSMFGNSDVVDTHRSSPGSSLHLEYGRGRPRPLFFGAAPKILLANLARPAMLKVYETHTAEIAQAGLGRDWTEFRTGMAALRTRGFYLSVGEMDAGVSAAAMPLRNIDGEVVAALALVGAAQVVGDVGEAKLERWLSKACAEFTQRMAATG